MKKKIIVISEIFFNLVINFVIPMFRAIIIIIIIINVIYNA